MNGGPTLSELRAPRPQVHASATPAARERAAGVDTALAKLYSEGVSRSSPMAVVAVGGYGRGELSPHSDVDLLFLFAARRRDDLSVRPLLYPLWDAGFDVGYSVRTPREAIDAARSDITTATALLSLRLVAGESAPFDELVDRRRRWIQRDRRQLVRRITDAMEESHARFERAGWMLAPDIKNDAGGLRDAHAATWLSVVLEEESFPSLGDRLLEVREALHACVPRKSDRLRMDLQPRVAEQMGFDDAGQLMAHVHSVARSVEHRTRRAADDALAAVQRGPRRSGARSRLGASVQVEDGLLSLIPEAKCDLSTAMSLVLAFAETGKRISSHSYGQLRAAFSDAGVCDRWPPEMRASFLAILSAPGSADALELLDHLDAWQTLLPEWSGVRALAQHDPYHRYTVDGHSFLAVAQTANVIDSDPLASSAALEADAGHTLQLAALLHDVGKGSGSDHSIAGEELARRACRRMGVDEGIVASVAVLVRHHLLLADTATRRDIDDGTVVQAVAQTLGSPSLLRLLFILTQADALATGEGAWTPWKASLVETLYRRCLAAIETGELPDRSEVAARVRELEAFDPLIADRARSVLTTLPPSYLEHVPIHEMADEVRLLLSPPDRGELRFHLQEGPDAHLLTLCIDDRPGALARTAGVLSLHGASVLRARMYSTSGGLALQRFATHPPRSGSWDPVLADLEAACAGRLAVGARLVDRARHYPGRAGTPHVTVIQDASAHSTVVEVRARDVLGLLHAIAAGISDLDVDIHMATIDTLGERVVDVFYVRTPSGKKLDDEQAAELERAIKHRVALAGRAP